MAAAPKYGRPYPTRPNPVMIANTGDYTTEANSTIAVSPKTVLAANASRTKLKLQNTSAFDYYVMTTGVAAAATGLLVPAGALYEWDANDMPGGAISVYSPTAGAGATYFVAEG